jgi:MtN3 and saliva related transmembrane protein
MLRTSGRGANRHEQLKPAQRRLCYSCGMHYLGLRHKTERKESKSGPKKTTYLVFLDKLTFIVGVIGPFTVLPQIYSIFHSHSAVGVSLVTWTLIFVVTFPWILYGLAHKDKSIITSFTLWEIANLAVMIGVLKYG